MTIKNQKPVEKCGTPQGIVNKVKSAAKALFAPRKNGDAIAGKSKLDQCLELARKREAALKTIAGEKTENIAQSKLDVGQAVSVKLTHQAKNVFVARAADDLYKLVKGKLILRNPKTGHGYLPDGDSVRFVADNPDDMKNLPGDENGPKLFNYKVAVVELAAGIFQLRFEAIDATELHYAGQAQPLGAWARDVLLSTCGSTNITYGPDGKTVLTCEPAEIDAYILFKGYDVYGRPICYVYVGNPPEGMKSGTWVNLTTTLLKESLNYQMLRKGIAYLTIYSSSPEEHRQVLISAARAAAKEKLGVWEIDQTNEFTFAGLASIGPSSTVAILPKLFRRLVDYVLDGGSDRLDFPSWLISTEQTKKNRNDVVIINGTDRKKLSEVITQKGNVIRFALSLFDCVFEEQLPAKQPAWHSIGKVASRISEHVVSLFSRKR